MTLCILCAIPQHVTLKSLNQWNQFNKFTAALHSHRNVWLLRIFGSAEPSGTLSSTCKSLFQHRQEIKAKSLCPLNTKRLVWDVPRMKCFIMCIKQPRTKEIAEDLYYMTTEYDDFIFCSSKHDDHTYHCTVHPLEGTGRVWYIKYPANPNQTLYTDRWPGTHSVWHKHYALCPYQY